MPSEARPERPADRQRSMHVADTQQQLRVKPFHHMCLGWELEKTEGRVPCPFEAGDASAVNRTRFSFGPIKRGGCTSIVSCVKAWNLNPPAGKTAARERDL
jgi:hypothetical protein